MSLINLKKQIEFCLEHYPETRDSDITLTIRVWKQFYPQRIKIVYADGKVVGEQIWVRDLYELPREDNIKRIRATINKDEDRPYEKRYLPNSWEVAKRRGILENDWKEALGYGNISPTLI